MEKIKVKSNKRVEFVEITASVQDAVARSKVQNGVCLLFCPHTTAGLTINENADPAVQSDAVNFMNSLIPKGPNFTHGEGNSDSHIKSSLYGVSLTIFIEAGKIALGGWQGVYFCEFDGGRNREVWIKVVGEK